MKIVVPRDLFLTATGCEHAAGDVIEVADAVGENLIEQGWLAPEPPEPKSAAGRKKPATAPDTQADPAEPKE